MIKIREKTSMDKNINRPLCPRLLIALLLTGFVASSTAQAAYCTVVGTRTTTFSALTLQRDIPVGALLAESIIPRSQVWDCSSAVGVVSGQYTGVKTYGTYNSLLDGVRIYNTDVTGVGYSLAIKGCGNAGWQSITTDSNYTEICSISGIWAGGNVQDSYRVRLYKTGPVTSGTITNQRIGVGITKIAGVWDNEAAININSFTITKVACSLSSTSINVPLGDVLISKFTGVGVSTADKSFNLGLTCDKEAKINVSLAGTQNTDTTEASVLALTSAGQTGTATGVGVQLLYGGTPLKINNNLALKTSTAGGKETLPFTARYYQTKATVGIGQANSSATLNITYQ
ncbi:Type-1A pilin [Serratia quinivorans]|nr:Type-1A pilin [Serratia quinivorans]CAI2093221.1 Type-1A pilin [Serratia quinivorans]